MTNNDNSLRASNSYHIAFRIGAVVGIVLLVYALLVDVLAGALLILLWSLATLFLIPPIYVWLAKRNLHYPMYFIKGPHQ